MSKKNLQVEGIRGITILMIVLFHIFCRYQEIYYDTEIVWMKYWGSFGVTVFLLISSYFLYSPPKEHFQFFRYLGKKALRLWPAYFISITIIFAVLALFFLPGRTVGLKDYLLNIFFINGFIKTPYVDGAHWYLTVLIAAIIICGIIRKLRLENKWFVYIIWAAISAVFTKFHVIIVSELLAGSYTGIIICGIALNQFVSMDHQTENKKKMLLEHLKIAAVGVTGIVFTLFFTDVEHGIELIIALPILYFVMKQKCKFLEWKPLVFIGGISYYLYLIHQNISFCIEYYMTQNIGSFSYLYGLVAFAAVFLLSVVMWLVSKSIHKYISFKKKLPNA